MTQIRKRYTKEEKLQIVSQSLEPNVNIKEIARRYGVTTNAIYSWRQDYNVYKDNAFAGKGNPVMTDEQKEISTLKKQIRELELEREILKKAMVIFSSPNKISLLSSK
jgi:transposase